MRISRPCYDKYYRCPGWNGGGNKFAKVQRCKNGFLGAAYARKAWKWRSNRCPTCQVVVLPYVVRYVDPTNWWVEGPRKWWRDLKYWQSTWKY